VALRIRIPANKPFFTESDREIISSEINKILESGHLTNGPWVKGLEEAFAEYTGTKFAIATNSGTSALEILLRYFDVSDREVIVPTNTFLSSGNAVIFAGGKPVLADISAETLSIDLNEIQRKITPKTKGVIAVHLAGLISPQIYEIRKFCIKKGLFLIEDAAHAPGASFNSYKAGNLSDGAAFSFYPTKPMTTGEGGMITTNDPECDNFARSLRSHGISIGEESIYNKNLLVRLGYNWRMSELQAVVGYFQLKNLDKAISCRNHIANLYLKELKDIPGITLFEVPANVRHSYYKFPVLFDKKFLREKIVSQFRNDFGVQVGSIYWPPCHLQPFYKERFGYKKGDFPVAEDVLYRTVALPIFPDMTEQDVLLVRAAIIKIVEDNTSLVKNRPKIDIEEL
jgi:dTDP-4-amino-4,6-dideoxygalactose transaminase